jgi:hypothetical protein
VPFFVDCVSRSDILMTPDLPEAFAVAAIVATKFWKSLLRLTKSVSLLTSTMVTLAVALFVYTATKPSEASLSALLAARAFPLARNQSIAFCRSPLTSSAARAFLQSIMGAPDVSRSCLTRAALISVGFFEQKVLHKGGDRRANLRVNMTNNTI